VHHVDFVLNICGLMHLHTAGIEDPNFFFQAIMAKPYAQNIIWGPHFYAQSVIPFALPKRFMEVRRKHAVVHSCPVSASSAGFLIFTWFGAAFLQHST
jgi:hypothetical protein